MKLIDRLLNSTASAADAARDRAKHAIGGSDRPSAAAVIGAGILGAAGGAIATLLLDPDRGRARRARFADQGAALVRRTIRGAEQIVRRVRATAEGRIAAIRASQATEARPIDDATLTDRVQSIVFRDDDVPKGDLNINVERGIVVLRGEVPDAAMRSRIVSDVEAVDGVWSVRDLLHLPGEPAETMQPTA